jgi:hypothetical protein
MAANASLLFMLVEKTGVLSLNQKKGFRVGSEGLLKIEDFLYMKKIFYPVKNRGEDYAPKTTPFSNRRRANLNTHAALILRDEAQKSQNQPVTTILNNV